MHVQMINPMHQAQIPGFLILAEATHAVLAAMKPYPMLLLLQV